MPWTFESQAALEALFGRPEALDRGPAAFVAYEEAIAPFLAAPNPELIRFTTYLTIDDPADDTPARGS